MDDRRQPADGRERRLTLEHSIRRVLAAQAVLALALVALVALATLLWSGPAALKTLGLARAQAVAFGSLLGILATVATARSVIKSGKAVANPHIDPHFGMLPLYSGLLFKLLIVAGGAFLGLVYLRLGPLYVVLGYITMQAGYVWAAVNSDRPR